MSAESNTGISFRPCGNPTRRPQDVWQSASETHGWREKYLETAGRCLELEKPDLRAMLALLEVAGGEVQLHLLHTQVASGRCRALQGQENRDREGNFCRLHVSWLTLTLSQVLALDFMSAEDLKKLNRDKNKVKTAQEVQRLPRL